MKTKNPTIIEWEKAQGSDFPHTMHEPVTLGPIYSDSWKRDPKHLGFVLARYKFVSKMLTGCGHVAEIGAGDGFASEIVKRVVNDHDSYDLSPLNNEIKPYDVTKGILPNYYDAIYALDIMEHVKSPQLFFSYLTQSLNTHGKLIVGCPSLEGQAYASEPSRKLHINCLSGEDMRGVALCHFHHVFMFSMNDEVVHTGFMPMAHYLFAVCAEPRR